jgi:hypothetical protein
MLKKDYMNDDLIMSAKKQLPDTVFGQLMLSDMLYQRIQNMQMEDSEKNDVRYTYNFNRFCIKFKIKEMIHLRNVSS